MTRRCGTRWGGRGKRPRGLHKPSSIGFTSRRPAAVKGGEFSHAVALEKEAKEGWAKLLIGAWTPRCLDETCRKQVAGLASELVVTEKQLQRDNPDESSLAIQKMISGQFGPRFKKAVDDSKKRKAVAGDPNASPGARLQAMGCTHFLGGATRWLCHEAAPFDACVGYVKGGQATQCIHPPSKRWYPPKDGPAVAQNDREMPKPTTPTGPVRLQGNGGRPPILIGGNQKDELLREGCKTFLGRADDYLCTTDEGYDACLAIKKNGRARECRRPQR